MAIDIETDVASLTAALVDIASVSGDEKPIADDVELALRQLGYLAVERDGNVVVARTDARPTATHRDGRTSRHRADRRQRALAPRWRHPARLRIQRHEVGCRSDVADGRPVATVGVATVAGRSTPYDLTYVFYDCEEIEAEHNGLGRLASNASMYFAATWQSCSNPPMARSKPAARARQGRDHASGTRAHSARAWLGHNAIHAAAPVLQRLADYRPRSVDIDGCLYREGLSAVRINGGIAGNVIPDACTVTINFRFAPDRDVAGAIEHVREVFAGYEVIATDAAPGALPRLEEPAAAAFVAAIGLPPVAKFGWTDVARFAELGIPAVNFGPGDPDVAHTRDERVDVRVIERVEQTLLGYLAGRAARHRQGGG